MPNASVVAKSVPFDNTSNGFTSDETQAAIEEAKTSAQGFPRSGVTGVYNGSIGNNSWLGPNELLPNTPFTVAPVTLQINEITWANQNTNVSFNIEFRTVSKTGTIFYTLSITSPNSGYGYVSGLALNITPGTPVYAQYKDTGTNCSDMSLTLWVSRVV